MVSQFDNEIILKKKITLFDGVGLIVGTIIGSGIFISPTGVFIGTKSVGASLLVWTASGILSTLGAFCFTELGTLITRSGGDYIYILESFGPLAAFIMLWVTLLIVRPTAQAIVALGFANYAVKPFFPTCEPPDSAVRLLAALCLFTLTVVNCLSIRWAMRVQNIFTIAKLIALAIIIVAGLVHIFQGNVTNFQGAFESEFDLAGLAFAFYSGLFAFGGWNYLNFVTEELQNPYKNLPKAIWIAMPLVTLLYAATNLAYFAVLSPNEILITPAVAVAFGNKIFGSYNWCIPIFVALSTFGSVNGTLFTSARLFIMGAEEKQLPEICSFIHITRKTPIPSVLLTCITSLIMLVSSDVFVLIDYLSQILWLSIAASIVGLLWLRHKRPNVNRPVKVHIAIPVIFLACCVFLIVVPMIAKPINTVVGLAITFSGIPVYYFTAGRKSKPECINKFLDRTTTIIQKIIQVVPREKNI